MEKGKWKLKALLSKAKVWPDLQGGTWSETTSWNKPSFMIFWPNMGASLVNADFILSLLLHWRLWLQPHDKLVTLGVNELLTQAQEGKGRHCDDEGEVETPQGEDLTLTKSGRHRLLAHQCPLTRPAGIQVLDCGAWAEVALKESLRDVQGWMV